MVKGMASPILVMVGLVFLGGWSARAEPAIALRADEITEEDGPGVPSSRQALPERVVNHEQGLQEDHEVIHQDGPGTHDHNSDTHQHGADAHQHDSGTGEHMTGVEGMGSHSEEMVDSMGDGNVEHSRMHEAGTMGEPAGGIMSGNTRDQGEPMTDVEGTGSHSEEMVGPMGNGNEEYSRMHESGAMSEPGGGMMSGNTRDQGEPMTEPAGGAVPEMRHRRNSDEMMPGHSHEGMMGDGEAGNPAGGMRSDH